MQLRNHIASHFLVGEKPVKWILEQFKSKGESEDAVQNVWDNIKPDNQPIFYVTNTIIDKIELLKVKQQEWGIFETAVSDGKRIFVFKNGDMLWSMKDNGMLFFLYCKTLMFNKEKAECQYSPLRVILKDNDILGDNQNVCDFIYSLYCFLYLSDTSTIIVNKGKSYGTKKQEDALTNDLNFDVTIVNSNWNITSINNKGFNVSGHFRLQPCGINRGQTKMIFIQPFKKNGYVKQAIIKTQI